MCGRRTENQLQHVSCLCIVGNLWPLIEPSGWLRNSETEERRESLEECDLCHAKLQACSLVVIDLLSRPLLSLSLRPPLSLLPSHLWGIHVRTTINNARTIRPMASTVVHGGNETFSFTRQMYVFCVESVYAGFHFGTETRQKQIKAL